jgi:hypothetical protein
MHDRFRRRDVVLGAAVLACAASGLGALPEARAEDVIELAWENLVPGNERSPMGGLMGIIAHGDIAVEDGPQSTPLTREYDGKRVRIPGYVVPLEYDQTGMRSLILVPYIGACVHVPPPPANQLIYVKPDEPYRDGGLFEAVFVTGTFRAAMTDTEITEVGYTIESPVITPYE